MNKKIKSILSSALCLAVTVACMSAKTVSASEYHRLGGMYQYAQEKNYWCGYAAMQSVLNNENKLGRIGSSYTQSSIVKYMGKNYTGDPNGNNELGWFYGSTAADAQYQSNFYAGRALKSITGFNYVAWPTGPVGSTEISSSDVKYKITSTTDKDHGVMICGTSRGSAGGSHMPGYPNYSVGHWVASDGYANWGNTICIVDPAKSDCVSWSSSISRYYSVSIDTITNFASYKGLIW